MSGNGTLGSQSDVAICPVTLLLKYLEVRGLSKGPLFRTPGGQHVTRSFLSKSLARGIDFLGLRGDLYKSHSFRIGGASSLAELGFSDSQIRVRGRCESDAFKKYIRFQRAGRFL